MVDEMGLQLTTEARRWLGDTEWLCHEHVPAKAIKRVFTVEQFQPYILQTRLIFVPFSSLF
jgi:hypothetical protein